jgi:hypothetical protein
MAPVGAGASVMMFETTGLLALLVVLLGVLLGVPRVSMLAVSFKKI